MLYELLYTSSGARDLTESHLLDLLETSKRKNARLAITGMLVFDHHEFMQILEGRKRDVLELYDEIRRDSRHQSVSTVHEGPITQRAFDGWSMAFRLLTKENPERPLVTFNENGPDMSLTNAIPAVPSTGKELFMLLRDDLAMSPAKASGKDQLPRNRQGARRSS